MPAFEHCKEVVDIFRRGFGPLSETWEGSVATYSRRGFGSFSEVWEGLVAYLPGYYLISPFCFVGSPYFQVSCCVS